MKRYSSCEHCGATWPGPSRICHCEGCHQTFTGEKPFDAHRRGHGGTRRCATPREMVALGLCQGTDGRWHRPAGLDSCLSDETTDEPRSAA